MLQLLKNTTLATLFAINAAVATTPFFIGKTQVTIESAKDAKMIVLSLKDLSNVPLKITIKDSKGEVLKNSYAEGDEDMTYRFNLSKLPEGDYQISISSSTDEFIQPIDVCKNCVNIHDNQLIEKHKPSFRLNEDKLDINLLNKSQEPVTVIISDKDGNKVVENTFSTGIAFGRRFDLAKLNSGDYTVTVKTKEESYYYDFNR
jgi:Domain of unknown function (DUF3244)